jgi:hypothetical protein
VGVIRQEFQAPRHVSWHECLNQGGEPRFGDTWADCPQPDDELGDHGVRSDGFYLAERFPDL